MRENQKKKIPKVIEINIAKQYNTKQIKDIKLDKKLNIKIIKLYVCHDLKNYI